MYFSPAPVARATKIEISKYNVASSIQNQPINGTITIRSQIYGVKYISLPITPNLAATWQVIWREKTKTIMANGKKRKQKASNQ